MKEKKADRDIQEYTAGSYAALDDFDDLVFEHRNKEYGAYQLRKKYHRVVLGGLIFAASVAVLSVLIPFLARPREEKIISGGRGNVTLHLDNLPAPEEHVFIPPAAPPPPPEKLQDVVKYVPPVVVDTVTPAEMAPLTTEEVLASQEGVTEEATGSGFGDGLVPGNGGGDSEEAYFQVEVMPSFRGGDLSKFREWVGKRTNYPQAAIDKKIRGTVFLTFIVEKDGSVSNVTVIKGIHPLLDTEAVKVISESPRWSPGLQRGQPVRVRFQIPLSFIY